MATHPAMSGWRLSRLPPCGEPIGPASLWRAWRTREAGAAVTGALQDRLGVGSVSLHASGSEALRVALVYLASRSGRREVLIPAYTCFSVPSAAVAAGLRVRLVDVDSSARIDLSALDALSLHATAAVVVCNLFGVPERLAPVAERAQVSGAAVIDDAAQCLGGRAEDGVVGARGDVGVLSFGRGKPIGALGGGALTWPHPRWDLAVPAVPRPDRLRALARALTYDLGLWPPAFRLLAAIPALRIGETRFEPDFAQGSIRPDVLALLAALLPAAAIEARRRAAWARELAAQIREVAGWRPILAPDHHEAVYPRLAVLAPSAGARERALAELTRLGAGASAMYPSSVDAIPALRSHLVAPGHYPGAQDFASRLLTLPTHGRLRGRRLERTLEVLGRA